MHLIPSLNTILYIFNNSVCDIAWYGVFYLWSYVDIPKFQALGYFVVQFRYAHSYIL